MKLINSMIIDMTAGDILTELNNLKLENRRLHRENKILNTKYDKLCRRFVDGAIQKMPGQKQIEHTGDNAFIIDLVNTTPPSAR